MKIGTGMGAIGWNATVAAPYRGGVGDDPVTGRWAGGPDAPDAWTAMDEARWEAAEERMREAIEERKNWEIEP